MSGFTANPIGPVVNSSTQTGGQMIFVSQTVMESSVMNKICIANPSIGGLVDSKKSWVSNVPALAL